MPKKVLRGLLFSICLAGCAQPRAKLNESRRIDLTGAYGRVSGAILQAALSSNDSWKKMEELCDGIGHRLSGSDGMNRAVDWAAASMTRDGQENVRAEKVMVPHWVRGEESLDMIQPRSQRIAMLGLGGSVGTPPEGITAEVVCVGNEEELGALGDRAAGKIVLFNNPMPPYDPVAGSGYGKTVRFRGRGASLAATKGAVACLVRSVTARSLYTPHTGALHYEDGIRQIPAAAITTEDAEMIARLRARGQTVTATLKMEAKTLPDAPSANVIAELRGSERPEEIVIISGHLDSWDVGQGAHDDGAGCVMSMEALHVLRQLKLRPKRTIRVVLWTNEENGIAGAKQYAADHADELKHHVAAIESDSGGFRPVEFSVQCTDEAKQLRAVEQMKAIGRLLAPVAEMKIDAGGSGADISQMKHAGFPLMGMQTYGEKYFDYHHTQADTLDKVDPKELSECVAVLAVTAYVIADMPEKLGEGN